METNYIRCQWLRKESDKIPAQDLETFITFLETNQYSERSVFSYVSCVIHYFSWRRKIDIGMQPITKKRIKSFLNRHLCRCHCPSSFHRGRTSSSAALGLWAKVVENNPCSEPLGFNETVLKKFDDHLMNVAGLAEATRVARSRYSKEFINWLQTRLSKDITKLSQQDIATYVYYRSANLSPGTITAMVCSLGSFATFLSANGYSDIPLPLYIPRPKPVFSIPVKNALTMEEVKSVLAAFDRTSDIGKRDYAMICCLVELGLRCSDATHITLDGIDWRQRTLTLEPGKNRRSLRLPLTDLLYEALADYVSNGRPVTRERAVFVYHRAPVGRAIAPTTLRNAIRRALLRAEVCPNVSQLHRFRHTLATRLLQAGTPLKSIADVLGHHSLEATNRYTHVDTVGMRAVALPWPQGGAS